MPNQFPSQPTLDTDFPKKQKMWTCPITGLQVPKDPAENLKWRVHILEMAEEDEDLQADLYTACSQSVLFWLNAFGYTLRVFQPGEGGKAKQVQHRHVPYLTWAIQDKHLLRIEECIDEGEELLTDKSRDMGATWDHIAVLVHRLLFRDSESHLVLSRKEDAVDILDGIPRKYPHGPVADPGTLFGKIDYMLTRLPGWMLPKLSRKKMHLVNLDNHARIDGESANATAGSSDRRTSIFLDEMAKMKEGESIKRSTKDVTACRLVCSTPNGAGTAYSKWRLSGQIPVFILPWWEHPEKGQDRYCVEDDLGRWKIRSPWYDAEEKVRSPKEMAIEIDMDHVGSGDTFFEGVIIEEHRKLFGKLPNRRMLVNWKKDVPDADIAALTQKRAVDSVNVHPIPSGHIQLWASLIQGRLDQSKTYTIGIDIGKGMGASNSTMSVMCNETREKVASFADANVPPYELAKIATAFAVWVGGRRLPLIIWENNGDPGFDFGEALVRVYNYPNIFFHRQPGTMGQKRGKRFGWRSSPEAKAVALGLLRRAYAHGGFINHDEKALDEALTYVQYEGGGIGPAELVEESSSARQTHGDRVIADMLCLVGVGEAPKEQKQETRAPARSMAHRMREWKKRKKARHSTKAFDWR